jgi:hypothetical protein
VKLTQAALKRQFDGLIRRAPGDPWCPIPTPNRGLSDSFCFKSAHECGRANSGKSGIDPKKHKLKLSRKALQDRLPQESDADIKNLIKNSLHS